VNASTGNRESSTVARPGGWLAAGYSIVLMVLFNIASVGLVSLPITYYLLDKHVPPTALSKFSLFTDIPFYVGFLFGFLRDRWRPAGKGDSGYFVLSPLAMVAAYGFIAFTPHTYNNLVIGVLMTSVASALLGAAAQGLLAAIAKDFGLTGRLAVVALVAARGGMMYNSYGGSFFNQDITKAALVSAGVGLFMLIFAVWHPRVIFRSQDEVFVNVIPEGASAAAMRLVRHTAVYLPALAIFLFEFAPGWGTPLTLFFKETLHLGERPFGEAQLWLRAGQIGAALSYALLCQRFRLKTLLYWGTLLAVIGGPAFLLIHGPLQADAISFVAGICCGIALASYYDLLVRSCPKELEGVAFMLFAGMLTLASDTSDLLGTWLYEKGGFALALGISTLFTALIFIPVILVPRSVTDPVEGERIVDLDPPEPEFALAPETA